MKKGRRKGSVTFYRPFPRLLCAYHVFPIPQRIAEVEKNTCFVRALRRDIQPQRHFALPDSITRIGGSRESNKNGYGKDDRRGMYVFISRMHGVHDNKKRDGRRHEETQ